MASYSDKDCAGQTNCDGLPILGAIMPTPHNRISSLALMALAAMAALACVSAIGAVTTLVVMATNAESMVPHDRECAVVAWKSGEVHCLRGNFAGTDKPQRGDLAVVTQAGSAR